MRRSTKYLGWAAAGAFGVAMGFSPRSALACGGLFCSSASPVNQAAERIVFAQDEAAGRVTAVIEILYQGPAERFAWILPVAGTPDVGVSTNALLNRLQQATNPNYQLQRTWREGCSTPRPISIQPTSAQSDDSSGANPYAQDCTDDAGRPCGSVSVLASGNAGPYDFQIITVAAGAADPAEEAIDWLTENGYDTGATGPDLLRPYLEANLNLLAVRLNKQSMVGSIRPIKLSYDGAEPMIPIRPTAVAANDDMGILVWVLGSSRAVPLNYKALELNEALLDWFNPQQSYNDVVIAAANETGDGQGFVTEAARPTNDLINGNIVDQLFLEQSTIAEFRSRADGMTDGALIADVVSRFTAFNSGFAFAGPFGAANAPGQVTLDGVADALVQNLTLPEGVDIGSVIASPRCYLDEFQTDNDDFYCDEKRAPEVRVSLEAFDRRAFLSDVEELVIAPIEDTVQLFADQPYMTRFYTTLSPDEMNADPVFSLNADLDDVSNQHQVTVEYDTCNFGDTSGPWQADFDGRIVRGVGNTWPLTLANKSDDMPVNLRILQLSASGPGGVYADNGDVIAQLLETDFGSDRTRSSGACSLGRAAPSARLFAVSSLLGLAALGAARRRARLQHQRTRTL